MVSVNSELDGMEREAVVAYQEIWPDGLKKIMKNLSQDSRSSGTDFNTGNFCILCCRILVFIQNHFLNRTIRVNSNLCFFDGWIIPPTPQRSRKRRLTQQNVTILYWMQLVFFQLQEASIVSFCCWQREMAKHKNNESEVNGTVSVSGNRNQTFPLF